MAHREFTILVVDDFAGWRSRISELLRARPELKIIAEACDGPEAIQKAAELKPNIALLDIQLPTLIGIEAGKLIRQVSPETRLIFLSAISDKEIVSAALRIGRARFVAKTEAATKLLGTIATALNDHCRPN